MPSSSICSAEERRLIPCLVGRPPKVVFTDPLPPSVTLSINMTSETLGSTCSTPLLINSSTKVTVVLSPPTKTVPSLKKLPVTRLVPPGNDTLWRLVMFDLNRRIARRPPISPPVRPFVPAGGGTGRFRNGRGKLAGGGVGAPLG